MMCYLAPFAILYSKSNIYPPQFYILTDKCNPLLRSKAFYSENSKYLCHLQLSIKTLTSYFCCFQTSSAYRDLSESRKRSQSSSAYRDTSTKRSFGKPQEVSVRGLRVEPCGTTGSCRTPQRHDCYPRHMDDDRPTASSLLSKIVWSSMSKLFSSIHAFVEQYYNIRETQFFHDYINIVGNSFILLTT